LRRSGLRIRGLVVLLGGMEKVVVLFWVLLLLWRELLGCVGGSYEE